MINVTHLFGCCLHGFDKSQFLITAAVSHTQSHKMDFVSSMILLLQRDASDGAPPPVLLLVAVCTTLLRPMGRIASPLRPKMDRVWPRRARRLTQEDEALIREVGGLDDGGDLGSVPVGK